jgi:uncharacterized protein GlcG (DUF336 family)
MPDLSLHQAQALVERAMAQAAKDHGKPICVAVCDERGLLLAFARMDGAPARSVQIAQGKAYSAARMGATTQAVLERLHREQIQIGYFCDPLLTALPGGSPLKGAEGRLVGGIGVSGLTSEQDQAITDATAAALAAG